MATNLHIDEKLLAKAAEVGGRKTKKQAVTDALWDR
jgi:Arc/MetJ family transcription regulator